MNFNPFRRFGLCPSKVLFFVVFVLIALAQPVRAETRFSFGDAVPSFHGGYYVEGIPAIHFLDTGENRFQKSGRVLKQTIGGPVAWGRELAEVYSFPFREPVLFGATVAGASLLIAYDVPLTAAYQDYVEPAFSWITPKPLFNSSASSNPIIRGLATEDQYMLLGMGLTFAYGFAFNDERAQVAAVLSAKAVAYSYLTTQVVLKPVFGRYRPVANLSSFSGNLAASEAKGFTTNPLKWWSSPGVQLSAAPIGTSFPSFHFTQYFAVARVYSGVYDNSWLPYVAAGALAVSNIRGHRHWVSDMAVGAVVGTVIGQSVLNNYSHRRGIDMSFTPTLSRDKVGAQFSMRF